MKTLFSIGDFIFTIKDNRGIIGFISELGSERYIIREYDTDRYYIVNKKELVPYDYLKNYFREEKN